jgi:hypothetical protein
MALVDGLFSRVIMDPGFEPFPQVPVLRTILAQLLGRVPERG